MSAGSDTARFWDEPSVADRTADRWGKPLSEQPTGSDAGEPSVRISSPTISFPIVEPADSPPPVESQADTPAASSLGPAPAGYVRRLTADLLDLGIVMGLIIIAGFALLAVYPDIQMRLGQAFLVALSAVYIFLGQLIGGQTIGMRLTGCKAVGRACAPVTPVQALARTLLWIPDIALRGGSFKMGMSAIRNPRSMADRTTRTWTIATKGPLASILPAW